ncbi:MAG: hypothetical protein RLZZ28_2486 [Bacteroidota bacterium]
MKWFLPFLAFIFFAELMAKSKFVLWNSSNLILYYIISIVESIFYGYVFYQLFERFSIKWLVIFLTSFILTAYFVAPLFFGFNHSTFLTTLLTSGFFLTGIALWYLFSEFFPETDKILIHEPGFWISFGVSIFFSGNSIVFSMYTFIIRNELSLFHLPLYNFVPRLLCIVLYSSISIAIILCKKKTVISY